MRITLAKIKGNKTVDFAFDELVKYLKLIDSELIVDERLYDKYDESIEKVIWVGLDEHFEFPEVECAELDDAILIDIADMSGVISGNNPRALLIAVYRFLKEMGCAWVRNTRDGEIIPNYSITPVSMYISEAASYRHRGVCIEGAVTFDHIRDMLDWIPKVGMNAYFVQFFLPTVFFERWYEHKTNKYLPAEPIDDDVVRGYLARIEEEIEKRGLLYHAIGHGWTSEPLGFDATGWHADDNSSIPEDKKILMAEIDGVRGFFKGAPMTTNLCYSNPDARKLVTNSVVDYCVSHKNVKYVHFWLADASNSFCECENCRDTIPSDHYVMMLNEIDEKLTCAGCDTKLVFLAYSDLLWAPVNEKLKNPDRFTLMFAPITRKFTQSFKTEDFSDDTVAPYVRNKLQMPKNVTENVAHLKHWLDFSNAKDGFDFDYHLMWDHQRDVGYYSIAKTLFDDMQSLEKIGLNGMVSCQLTRAAFPTGLPMQMMADALWDKECDFEEKSDEYFLSAFGADGLAVKEYTKRLSELFKLEYVKLEIPYNTDEARVNLNRAIGLICEFKNTIKANLDTLESSNLRTSWEYLDEHAEITRRFAEALIMSGLTEDDNEKVRIMEDICDYVNQREMKLHRVLDGFFYYYMLRYVIAKK